MAVPVALQVVFDIPLSTSEPNIIKNVPGSVLAEKSLVQVFLNGETANVEAQISVGGAQVLPQSQVTVQATDNILPTTPDDIAISTFGEANNEITIRGTNLDAAAARQLRTKVQTFPSSDIMLLAQALRSVGVPIS